MPFDAQPGPARADWWRGVAGNRLLTPTEERLLARRIAEGDLDARNTLIERNLRLVGAIAGRWKGRGVPFEDLVQEGCIGLAEAAARYDSRIGRFSTYATFWIRRCVQNAVLRDGTVIRPSFETGRELQRVARVRVQLEQELLRQPTLTELAAELELPVDRLRDLLRIDERVLSLDVPLPDCPVSTLTDTLEDEPVDFDAGLTQAECRATLRPAVDHLPLRQRHAVKLKYGLYDGVERDNTEVGKLMNCTRQNVAHALRGAHRNLRPVAESLA